MRLLLVAILLVSMAAVSRGADDPLPLPVVEAGGHRGPIWKILFHPTKDWLVSISEDQTIRLWDHKAGTLLRVIRPPRGAGLDGKLLAADISPDGKHLAVAGNGYWNTELQQSICPIYIIDIETGKLVGETMTCDTFPMSLSFQKRGGNFLAVAADKMILYDLKTRKPVSHLFNQEKVNEKTKLKEKTRPVTVAFCPGDKNILAVAYENGIVGRLWLNEEDVLKSRFEKRATHSIEGDTCVAWRNNSEMVSCGYDGTVLFYPPNGDEEPTSLRIGLKTDPIRRLLQIAPVGKDGFVLSYGPGSRRQFPEPIHLTRENDRWTFVKLDVEPTPYNEWYQAVACKGDFIAASGYDDHSIVVWNLRSRTYIRLRSFAQTPWGVTWNRDGTGFAIDPEHVKEIRWSTALDLGKMVSVGEGLTHDNYPPEPQPEWSIDEKGPDADTKILILHRGRERIRLPVEISDRVRISAFSRDGTRVAVGTNSRVLVFDVKTRKQIVALYGHRLNITNLSFHPRNPELLLSASADQTVYLWDLLARKERYGGIGITTDPDPAGLKVTHILSNGPAARDRRLRVGDVIVAAGNADGPTIPLAGVSVTTAIRGLPQTKVRLQVKRDKVARPIEIELTREEREDDLPSIGPHLAFIFVGVEWVAIGPHGVYDCSPGGHRLMGWQIDRTLGQLGTFLPVDAFRKTLHQPDLVKELAKGTPFDLAFKKLFKNEKPKAMIEVNKNLPPWQRIVEPGPNDRVERLTTVIALVEKKEGPRPRITLVLDQKPVRVPGPGPVDVDLPAVISEEKGAYRVTWKSVEIPPGEHVLQVRIKTAHAEETGEAVAIVGPVPVVRGEKPKLHLLTFGVSKAPGYGVLPAAEDCKQFKKILTEKKDPAFGELVHYEAVDQTGTAQNLKNQLINVKKAAKPGDMVIVYCSCHGISDQGYYLVPTDVDPAQPAQTSVNIATVREELRHTKGKCILLLDSCFSGQAAMGPFSNQLKELTDEGLIVGCSCRPGEKSHSINPDRVRKMSLFTYVLHEVLRGEIRDREKEPVNLGKLEYLVARHVVEISKTKEFGQQQTPVFAFPPGFDKMGMVVAVP